MKVNMDGMGTGLQRCIFWEQLCYFSLLVLKDYRKTYNKSRKRQDGKEEREMGGNK